MADVKLTQVRKSFGEIDIIRGVDLDIKHGEFVVFVGPSGCGKSTLLRAISGLEDITSGELRIGDQVMNHVDPSKRGIAMVFQSYALYPNMTVAQNIAFGLEIRKVPKAERKAAVDRVSAMLQIGHLLDRKPGQLSGGQRQRLALARAVAARPAILVLDDPLSALDVDTEALVEEALRSVLTTTTALIVAHRPSTVQLADRVALMQDGRITAVGKHSELLATNDHYRYVISSLDAAGEMIS